MKIDRDFICSRTATVATFGLADDTVFYPKMATKFELATPQSHTLKGIAGYNSWEKDIKSPSRI